MREAIEFHIEGLRLQGDPVPQPTSICEYIAKVNRNRRPVEPPRFDLCQASPAKIAGTTHEAERRIMRLWSGRRAHASSALTPLGVAALAQAERTRPSRPHPR